jgi:hypothetical protein
LPANLIDNLHFYQFINNHNNLHFQRSSTITIIQNQNTSFNKHTINLCIIDLNKVYRLQNTVYIQITKQKQKIQVLHHQLSSVIVGFEDMSGHHGFITNYQHWPNTTLWIISNWILTTKHIYVYIGIFIKNICLLIVRIWSWRNTCVVRSSGYTSCRSSEACVWLSFKGSISLSSAPELL